MIYHGLNDSDHRLILARLINHSFSHHSITHESLILTISDYISKLYLHGWSRGIIFVLFLVLIGFSVYKVTTIQQGIVPEDAVAEDR